MQQNVCIYGAESCHLFDLNSLTAALDSEQ